MLLLAWEQLRYDSYPTYFKKLAQARVAGVGGGLGSEEEPFKSKSGFSALLLLELTQTYLNLLIISF